MQDIILLVIRAAWTPTATIYVARIKDLTKCNNKKYRRLSKYWIWLINNSCEWDFQRASIICQLYFLTKI